MTETKRTYRDEFILILQFVGAIWAFFFLSWFTNIDRYGLYPRNFSGLIGIVSMPFLHANLRHIIGNTIPLIVLLSLLAGSKSHAWQIVIAIIVGNGVLLWIFGRSGNHIGASGLVFGLIAFLILSGFLEKRFLPLVVSIITLLVYGGNLIGGILPTAPSYVSWDGHLTGVIAGAGVSWVLYSGLRTQKSSR